MLSPFRKVNVLEDNLNILAVSYLTMPCEVVYLRRENVFPDTPAGKALFGLRIIKCPFQHLVGDVQPLFINYGSSFS